MRAWPSGFPEIEERIASRTVCAACAVSVARIEHMHTVSCLALRRGQGLAAGITGGIDPRVPTDQPGGGDESPTRPGTLTAHHHSQLCKNVQRTKISIPHSGSCLLRNFCNTTYIDDGRFRISCCWTRLGTSASIFMSKDAGHDTSYMTARPEPSSP
jgi:hypothetical protein